ncbi:C4-dicarboxylate transporter/malic acid transport protein [Aspergillus sclerotiicarbonarius CBS 121057]|uniref:C4-dicarboxylate transporter/malic acid transport protein n=1 Tax=Aspergillus sclerotiicarbonarius (strain CBS 121057 / IBT 28362) TaxID=1448318 RepID=A0A319E7T2_ASPSB|nr:C4-dicarboxylate transporter/malic acid transport protein [Aspergillus sclerotiicarbonarius CBS 121057]
MHVHDTLPGSSSGSDLETFNHEPKKFANHDPEICVNHTSEIAVNHGLEKPGPISFRERLHHFTWAWYTLTMSCGGLALLIVNQPHDFKGLKDIARVVYCLNIFFFTVVTSLMVTRFIMHNNCLDSLRHDREGLFFPTFWLSIATMITGLYKCFGDDASERFTLCLEVLFWLYTGCTLIAAVLQYSFVFQAHQYHLHSMMPSWILPAFPVMLSGTIASVIGSGQPPESSIPIVVAGTTFQGLGFSISFMMYAHYIGRLMEVGLPSPEHRPGMFICVGPPAFTALALVGMAKALPQDFSLSGDATAVIDGRVMLFLATSVAIFLWALSFWFFCIAAVAVIRSPPTSFHLNWFAMVFPNTGFTLATITLANQFDSAGVKGVATAMSLCVIIMFIFVLLSAGRAVYRKDIMYPGRDEDVSE